LSATLPEGFGAPLDRVRDTPPSAAFRRMLWILLGFVTLLVAWSCVARLDIVAVAEGKLVPATYLKILQPAEGGVVKEILVREGESVKTGQVLMRMDAALSESELRTLKAESDARRLAVRRIDAQLDGRSMVKADSDPPEAFARARAQYIANLGAHESALAQERASLEKTRHELAVATDVRNKLKSVLPHYRQQEAAYEKLVKDGFAGNILYTDKQRERIEKEQDLNAQESAILAARAAIAQSERKLAQIAADYRKGLEAERAELVPLVEKSAQDLMKQQHRHRLLELKAPQDGVVKDLATHTVGAVASPGTILMTLVPREEVLRAEVWVRNDDVGFVTPGQPVRLKLATFLFQKYGLLDGEVLRVSADAADGGDQATRNTNASPLAYKTLVTLKRQSLDHEGRKLALSPGMQVSAEIHLGTRTVAEYLLSPVQKAWHEAARER
jgi:HlyD family secretion protein